MPAYPVFLPQSWLSPVINGIGFVFPWFSVNRSWIRYAQAECVQVRPNICRKHSDQRPWCLSPAIPADPVSINSTAGWLYCSQRFFGLNDGVFRGSPARFASTWRPVRWSVMVVAWRVGAGIVDHGVEYPLGRLSQWRVAQNGMAPGLKVRPDARSPGIAGEPMDCASPAVGASRWNSNSPEFEWFRPRSWPVSYRRISLILQPISSTMYWIIDIDDR